jgi:hypothetical protein
MTRMMKGSMVEAKGFVMPSLHSQATAADCATHAAPPSLHRRLHHRFHLRRVENRNARLSAEPLTALPVHHPPSTAPPWLEMEAAKVGHKAALADDPRYALGL